MMDMQTILLRITFLLQLTKKSFTCFCFLGFLWSQEASIKGFILDSKNRAPIHGANVFAKELGVGTVSRVDGHFILDNLPEGKVSITIAIIGYEEVDKSIFLEKDILDIGVVFLTREVINVKEVVVNSHLELQPKKFSSNSYIVGNQYHTELKMSLASTLEEEVGMSIRSMGQGTRQPVLRGYAGDRLLLTEDGITAGDLSNTSIDHSISMDMISYNSVKIIRGPEALLYGSNTIGGVIDVSRIIDPNARFEDPNFHAILGHESSNKGVFGNIVCNLPFKDNHQLRFSMLGRNAEDQVTPVGPLLNTALTNSELLGSYTYFGKDYRSTFSYGLLNMDYGIPGTPEGHIDGVDITMDKSMQRFSFHKDISFMGFQTLDVDQRYIDYSHYESEKGSSYPAVSLGQKIFSLQNIFKNRYLQFGSLIQYRSFKAGGFYWTPDTKEYKIALFGLFQKKYNDFVMQISSRAEYLSVLPNTSDLNPSNLNANEIKNRAFPLFSFAVALYKNWKNFEISIGTMVTGRAPGIEDLYSDGPHLGTYAYEIGMPTLEQEQIIGLEASITYKSDISFFRFTGYQNSSPNYHISSKMGNCEEEFIDGQGHPCAGADYIEWGSGSTGWLYKYQLEGISSAIIGFESDFKYEMTGKLNFSGSISMIRGNNTLTNLPLSYMPPDKFLFSTNYDLNPVFLSLQFKKVSSQTRLGEFETVTKGYLTADLNGSYVIHSTRMTHKLVFQIGNIFDETYYNHLSRVKMIMPEKGRSVSIQYRILF